MVSTSYRPGLCGLLASSVLVLRAAAIDMVYCANINTATTASNYSIFQSDGLCHDFCYSSSAYAVIQGNLCWCSDYTPSKSDQVAISKCNEPCDGYPSDTCGADGLWGYMALALAPSGTAAGGTSTSTSTTTSSSSTSTSTTSTTSTSTTSASSIAPSTSIPPSSSSSTAVGTPTVHTVTAGGVVQTVTVTPSAGAGTTNSATSKSHKGLSSGAAAGLAVGVVALVIMAAVIAYLVWRRRQRQERVASSDGMFAVGGGMGVGGSASNKTTSPHGSSPNMTGTAKAGEMSATPAFARRPGGEAGWEADQSGRRRSTLMPIDPRIDPAYSGIYTRADNKSRDSVNSLRDDHDYSRRVHQPGRVLRATNPDPED